MRRDSRTRIFFGRHDTHEFPWKKKQKSLIKASKKNKEIYLNVDQMS